MRKIKQKNKYHYRTLSFSYRSRQDNYVIFDCTHPSDLVTRIADQIGHLVYMDKVYISNRFMIFKSVRCFKICESGWGNRREVRCDMDEVVWEDELLFLPPRNEEVTVLAKEGGLKWKVLMIFDWFYQPEFILEWERGVVTIF